MPQFSTDVLDGNDRPSAGLLIVEDDAVSRRAIEGLLRSEGMTIDSTGTLASGLLALDRMPACIILDLMLPDGSGLSLLKEIRRRKLPAGVAVLTGVSDPHLVAEIRALSPDLLLQKPIEMQKLLAWVRECANRSERPPS